MFDNEEVSDFVATGLIYSNSPFFSVVNDRVYHASISRLSKDERVPAMVDIFIQVHHDRIPSASSEQQSRVFEMVNR